MSKIIPVVLASDNNYFWGLFATILSIRINADENTAIRFYVFEDGIEESYWTLLSDSLSRLKAESELIRISLSKDAIKIDLPSFRGRKTAIPYARILIPEMIQEDRVIYVDVDILFLKDITSLWDWDLSGKTAAAAIDMRVSQIQWDCPNWQELSLNPEQPYFNSGLLVMDVNRSKAVDLTSRTLEYLRKYPNDCKFWDQSALNVTLYDDIAFIEQSWNFQIFKLEMSSYFERLLQQNSNIHFTAPDKPWQKLSGRPQNLMFVRLLECFGVSIDQENKEFSSIDTLLKYKQYLFRFRSRLKHILRFHESAQSDAVIADYWKSQHDEGVFLASQSAKTEQLLCEWNSKIQQAMGEL